MTRQQSCDEHRKWTAGCDGCNAKARRYTERRRLLAQRGVRLSAPAEITASRLRQLRALGYSKRQIGALVGMTEASIWRLCDGQRERVTLRVFHAVERVWLELAQFPNPHGDPRVIRQARAAGWKPPKFDEDPVPFVPVDEIAIERAMSGERVKLNRDEQNEAFRRLTSQGKSWREISRLLHVSDRTINRWSKETPQQAVKRTRSA